MKSAKRSIIAACATVLFGMAGMQQQADACTRFVYHGAGNEIFTGRSMDYKIDTGTHLWMFPRGMQRNGETGPDTLKWTSRYGSVIASAYDISTTDGMNEAGLVANLQQLLRFLQQKTNASYANNVQTHLQQILPEQHVHTLCAPADL